MDAQFRIQFQLGDAAQIFLQNGGFDLQLMFVAGVLIMAASAALKIRARRLGAPWRSCDDPLGACSNKARLLLEQAGFDSLAFQDEGYEGRFAPAVFIRGQAGQTVAAIDKFFDGEFQELILQRLSIAGVPA